MRKRSEGVPNSNELPHVEKLLVKGCGGTKQALSIIWVILSLYSGKFKENQKIDSINAGLERRARDKEQSEIQMFPRDHDKSCPFVSFYGYPLQLL